MLDFTSPVGVVVTAFLMGLLFAVGVHYALKERP